MFIGKQFHGIYDRFAPGNAWYHNPHSEGQLGYAYNSNPQATFYSLSANKKDIIAFAKK